MARRMIKNRSMFLVFVFLLVTYMGTIVQAASVQNTSVSVGVAPAIKDQGTVADIKIDETVKGALVNSNKAEDRTITLTILGSEFEFANSKPVVTLGKGFDGIAGVTTAYGINKKLTDKQVLCITLPQRKYTALKGTVDISQISVKALTKNIKSNTVQIEVSGTYIGKKTVMAAIVKDYGFTVINKLPDPTVIKSGSKNNIGFSVKEVVLGSMYPKQKITVNFTQGYLSPSKAAEAKEISIGSIKLNGQDITKKVVLEVVNKEDYLTGFSFLLPAGISKTQLNELTFNNLLVYTPSNVAGEVIALVTGENMKEEASAAVAVVKQPVAVAVEPFKVKVGLKDQVGGKVIISETDKGMLEKGILEIEVEEDDSLYFTGVPAVTVLSGNIKLGEISYEKDKPNIIEIEILNLSKTASVIEVKNFVLTANGMAADGLYKLTIKGSALTPDETLGKIESEGFISIGQN